MTLATAKGFEVQGKATHKAKFLAGMEAPVPWRQFCETPNFFDQSRSS